MKSILLLLMLVLTTDVTATTTRTSKARYDFKKLHPCPNVLPHTKTSCPGFVIDHIKPLACGGRDIPSNMQWQTTADAKMKDKYERKGCSK